MESLTEPKIINETRQGELYSDTFVEAPHPNLPKGKFLLETYGCQMNFSDSEIVASVLAKAGYSPTADYSAADLIFLNTCSIRENAEQKIFHRLRELNGLKKKKPDLLIGILGCMAERLKNQLLEEEKIVDMVVGPDAYRDLPKLVTKADEGERAINVLLSREETYADINPVRIHSNGTTAFISIMRGCDNMCSFCVVPFTRGRERSRNPETIVKEARDLFENGFKEVTLLGQNVDSYFWSDTNNTLNFAGLFEKVAQINPELRVRFMTSHPKDMTDEVLMMMRKYENICKSIHLPVQSGSTRILTLMKREYTREWYLDRIKAIRNILGEECGITTDIIAGFCTEKEEDHLQTLSLMENVNFDYAFTFTYSERPGTLAARNYKDDVPENVKKRRLQEIITFQKQCSNISYSKDVGKRYQVLAESVSKKSEDYLYGRNSQNKGIVFPKEHSRCGEYVEVRVVDCTTGTLIGVVISPNL